MKERRRAGGGAEPIRAALGAGQSVDAALQRLRGQSCDLAPVIRKGRAAGFLDRASLEAAVRHGLQHLSVGSLVAGGAPVVRAGASGAVLARSLRCTAPAALVRGTRPGQIWQLSRRALDGAWGSIPGAPAAAASARLIRAGLSVGQRALVRRAAAIARAAGTPLFLAGGVVRDLAAGRTVKDLDLLAGGDAATLARRLSAAAGGRLTVHPRFMTARVLLPDGSRMDLTTARREIYSAPGALPQVRPGSIEQDMERRDVTINAMALRLDGPHRGVLLDPLGGWTDLRRRVLRTHYALSVTEDPTRAFRIGRLAARLRFRLAPETRHSVHLARATGAFDAVSGERFLRELDLIAAEGDPIGALLRVQEMESLDALAPGLCIARGMRRAWRLRPAVQEGLPAPGVFLLMLCAAGIRGAARRALARRMGLAGSVASRFLEAPAAAGRVLRALRAGGDMARMADRVEREHPEALLLAAAGAPSPRVLAAARACLRARTVRPRVQGSDLARMGLPPGPRYGEILKALRDAILSGRVRGVAAQRRFARRLVKAGLGASAR